MNSLENCHKCSQCTYETPWNFAFNNHFKKHRHKVCGSTSDCFFHKDSYYCEFCGFETDLKVVLLKHLKLEHKLEVSSNKQTLSSENFLKKEPIEASTEIFEYNPNLRCHFCGLETFSHLFLMKHGEICKVRHQSIKCLFKINQCENSQKSSSNVDSSEAKWFECSICDFHSGYKHSLNRHYRLKHTNTCIWFMCSICDYKSNYKPNLKIHQKKVHSIKTEIEQFENDIGLKCRFCDYRAREKGRLKRHHIVNHLPASEGKWFECIKCVYKTRRKDHLKRHYINTHISANEGITAKPQQSHHIRHNSNKRPSRRKDQVFTCIKCDYKTKRKYDLDTHNLNNHLLVSEGKWFECATCEYKARRKEFLKKHMSKHATSDKFKFIKNV